MLHVDTSDNKDKKNKIIVSPSHLVGSPIVSYTQWSDRSVYQDTHAHHRSPSPRRSSLKDGRIFTENADDKFRKDLETRKTIRRKSCSGTASLDAHLILVKGCGGRTQRLFASLKKFDSEGGGYVTHDSLSRSIHRLGIEMSSDQLNGLIHFHDRRGSGFIEIESLLEAVDRAAVLKNGEESIEILVAAARRKITNSRFALDAKKCLDSFRRCDKTKSGLVTLRELKGHLGLIRVVLKDSEMNAILEASRCVEEISTSNREEDKIQYGKFVAFVYSESNILRPPGLTSSHADQRSISIESSHTRRAKLTREKLGRKMRSCNVKLLRQHLGAIQNSVPDAKDLRNALSSCGVQIGEDDSVCVIECAQRNGRSLIETIQNFGVVTDDGDIETCVHKHAPWTKKSSSSGLVPDEGKRRQFSSSRGSSHNMYGVLSGVGGEEGNRQSRRSRKARTHIYWQQCASSDISDAMRLEKPRKKNVSVVEKSPKVPPPRVFHLKRGLI